MKINDIRKFISTDRRVHVAFADGSSKDGFLNVVIISDEEAKGKSWVRIQGDRGRPSTHSPFSIEDISWHPSVPDPQTVKPIRKSCAKCGKTGVTLTVVKGEPGFRMLLCKEDKAKWDAEQEAKQSAKASRTAGRMVQAVLLVDARPTIKELRKELDRLDKSGGVPDRTAAALKLALDAVRLG